MSELHSVKEGGACEKVTTNGAQLLLFQFNSISLFRKKFYANKNHRKLGKLSNNLIYRI